MKMIPKEYVIAFEEKPLDGNQFSARRVVVRVVEEPCGFWLGITGYNDEVDESAGENDHEFYLQSIAEIDEFAAMLKKILSEAEHKTE